MDEVLQPGIRIDRYGDNGNAQFFSPNGTPWSQRSLPPGSEDKKFISLEVLKEIPCSSGEIAPWFNQLGGGIQYYTNIQIESLTGEMVDATLENLIINKYVKVIKEQKITMNIKTLKEAFEIINIDMLYDEGIIREKKASNEGYYGFQFSEKLWNIFSYQRGNKKILYSFDEKSKAVKHFMIFMIKKKILKEYLMPIISDNPIIYDANVSYADIINIFNSNNIKIEKLYIYSLSLINCDNYISLIVINNIEKKKIYVNDMTDITDALFVFLQFGIVLYNYIALISTIENSGIKINALNDKDIITLLSMT